MPNDNETKPTAGAAGRALSAIIIFAIVFGAAGIGAALGGAMTGPWYQELNKPAFSPPSWVFGPVWTVLYATMALAAWLIWIRRPVASVALPLALFGVQLFFNMIWSGLFFRLHLIGAAAADIVLIWLATAATIAAFLRVSRPAGLILLPYLVWLTFAGVLNFSIWRLNA